MTRINLVPPSTLSTKHCIAEYRELPRVFGLVRRAIRRGESPLDKRNPNTYTLGKGHVRFFYNRTGWLRRRMDALVAECLARGFRIAYTKTDGLLEGIPAEWLGDASWTPSESELNLNRERIRERENR